MSRAFYIVGAGDMNGTSLRVPDGAFVIAADAGLSYLREAGISADLIVGDFDSLGEKPSGPDVVSHSPEKDDTDMLLAVREALERKARTIVIYGGLGGRIDHEYANLQTLAFIANSGARGYLVGRGSVCTVIKNGAITFDGDMTGTISVFSQGGGAEGVNLTGLKYPLTNHTLTDDYPLGVSNEFTGVPSRISVESGLLLVIWNALDFNADRYENIYN
ncbi:MAG: thiamine diphosphokinase [Oscillospiraceae bacterium]|nr:thiamine diphosphokinase [Oscillospiraceae bacterium]